MTTPAEVGKPCSCGCGWIVRDAFTTVCADADECAHEDATEVGSPFAGARVFYCYDCHHWIGAGNGRAESRWIVKPEGWRPDAVVEYLLREKWGCQ